MLRLIARLRQCFYLFLVICIFTLSTAQVAFSNDSTTIISQDNSLTFVDKQPISEVELFVLDEPGNVDQVTAGHRPVPVPSHRGAHTSDIFFWAGFSLIMLSIAIYPY